MSPPDNSNGHNRFGYYADDGYDDGSWDPEHDAYVVGYEFHIDSETFLVAIQGLEFPDAQAAKAAFELIASIRVPDAGASRCKDPADPDGAARFLVVLCFGGHPTRHRLMFAIASDPRCDVLSPGKGWRVPAPLVNELVSRRVRAAASGEHQWVIRGRE